MAPRTPAAGSSAADDAMFHARLHPRRPSTARANSNSNPTALSSVGARAPAANTTGATAPDASVPTAAAAWAATTTTTTTTATAGSLPPTSTASTGFPSLTHSAASSTTPFLQDKPRYSPPSYDSGNNHTWLISDSAKQDAKISNRQGLSSSPSSSSSSSASAGEEPVPLTDVTITAQPPSAASRRYMWLVLFLFTVLTGGGIFLFRVQVVVMGEDKALDPGTFIAFLCMGSFACQMPYVLVLCRKVVSARPNKFLFLGLFAGLFNCTGMNGYVLLTSDGGEASLLAPLTSLWVVLPVLYGVVVLGDRLSLRRSVGVLVSISAALFFAFSGGGSVDLSNQRTLGLYFTCFFGWGICTILFQLVSVAKDGSFAAGYGANVVGFALAGVVFVAALHRSIDWTLTAGHAIVLVGGGLHGLGTLGFIILSKQMPEEAAVVAPLSSLTVLWPVFLGMAVLGESSNAFKIVGIFCSVTGVLLMGIRDLNELKDMIFKKRAEPVVFEHVDLTSPKPGAAFDVTPAVVDGLVGLDDTHVVIKNARSRKGRVQLTLEITVPMNPSGEPDVVHLPTITVDPNIIENDDDDDEEEEEEEGGENNAEAGASNTHDHQNRSAVRVPTPERHLLDSSSYTSVHEPGVVHLLPGSYATDRPDSTTLYFDETLVLPGAEQGHGSENHNSDEQPNL